MQKMVSRPADGAVGDDDAAEEPSRSGTPVSPSPPPALMPVPPAHIHTHQPRLCGLSNLTRDGQVPDDDDLDDPRNRRKRVAAAAAAQAEDEKRRMEEWVVFYVCV